MPPVSNKQPLYDQLVDLLRDKIQSEMKPGDPLPSERELSVRYGLSRTTVRLALRELEDLGLIYKKHGKGSFVTDHDVSATDLTGTYSFTDQMKELGRNPQTTILTFEVIEANKFLAKHMGVAIGEKIYYLRRLRSANGIAMMVEKTYLPVQRFLLLTRSLLEQKPLYTIVEQDFQHKIKVAEEEFSASIARYDDAKALGIAEGSPVLYILRTTYNDKNHIIEFTESIARADQFKYKVSHVKA